MEGWGGLTITPDKRLIDLIERSKAVVAAMSEKEIAEMLDGQKQSYLRSCAPCEHGNRDWETCPDCWEGWD